MEEIKTLNRIIGRMLGILQGLFMVGMTAPVIWACDGDATAAVIPFIIGIYYIVCVSHPVDVLPTLRRIYKKCAKLH